MPLTISTKYLFYFLTYFFYYKIAIEVFILALTIYINTLAKITNGRDVSKRACDNNYMLISLFLDRILIISFNYRSIADVMAIP